MSELLTAGVDVGTGAVKVAILKCSKGAEKVAVLATARERLHRRDPSKVAELCFQAAMTAAHVTRGDLAYVASTGEGDAVSFRDGHFYGMTTHARGATFLFPEARAVVDLGALHARVMVIDATSRVLASRMTSQCASGTGQFVENIARYLGIRLDEIGPMSEAAPRAEVCSGICAVLAETDVINMVSRGIPVGEILRGIHESIATRIAKLLRTVKAQDVAVLTGGLASDSGMVTSLARALEEDKGPRLKVLASPMSVHAGALGAALWAVHRVERLARQRAREQDLGASVLAVLSTLT